MLSDKKISDPLCLLSVVTWTVIKKNSFITVSLQLSHLTPLNFSMLIFLWIFLDDLYFLKVKKQSSAFHTQSTQNDKNTSLNSKFYFSAGNCYFLHLEATLIRVLRAKLWEKTLKCCRADCYYLSVDGTGQVAYSEFNIVFY